MTIPYYTKNVLPIKCFKFSLDRGLQQFILNKGTAKRASPRDMNHCVGDSLFRNIKLCKCN